MKKQILITLFLFLVFSFLLYEYINEREKNRPYRESAEIIKREIINKSGLKASASDHPLEIEKEKKEKFAESLKDEKIILVSDEILNNINLEFLK
jgi:hypothetical protein